MIKLIIFDAGDILYDWHYWSKYFGKRFQKLLKTHGVKDIENEGKLWDRVAVDANTGKISLQEAHGRHLVNLGLSKNLVAEYEKLDREALAKLKVKDTKTREILTELKARGYKIAILSDTPHSKSTKNWIIKNIGLGELFDAIFVSSEIGHMKPDKEAYFTVLNSFKIKPTEAVFVGHDEDELVGAKKIGMKTISYLGHHSGDFVIKKFSEILDVVISLR